MAVYDTTNVIDNSMFLKAKLSHNMVGDNFYIENFQDKRNQEWEYRHNVVDIEEELEKQIDYTEQEPQFTPIDVAISHVKGEFGQDLSSDWGSISFKDLNHACGIGYRYRFFEDFSDMSQMDEEEKKYGSSVWICVNKSTISPGNRCMIRRCNTALPLIGSPDKSEPNRTEVRFEPCILENEMKYMQVYYNLSVPVPQAEWYAIMQLNYFTNFIEINNRFLFGTIDPNHRTNNQVYKVKAVLKATANKTFVTTGEDELKSSPLVVLALDKDVINPEDDLDQRIAKDAPVYPILKEVPFHYHVEIREPFDESIPLGQSSEYVLDLYRGEVKAGDMNYTMTGELSGIVPEHWNRYFTITKKDDNVFEIKNLKTCTRGVLTITYQCNHPTRAQEYVVGTQDIKLAGFY